MEFAVEQNETLWILTPEGDRLDAAQAVRFKEGVIQIIDQGANEILLDLQHIKFLDSSGLGALVALLKYMGTERAFELCGLNDAVAKVFKLTRMDSIFTIFPDRNSAQSFKQEQAS